MKLPFEAGGRSPSRIDCSGTVAERFACFAAKARERVGETSGALAVGTYRVGGTVSDATGDKGTFSFVLSVHATPPPPPAAPVATRVVGYVVAGKTRTIEIMGAHFVGQPLISSHAGTVATVSRDTGTELVVRVRVKTRSRNGVFTFTITNPDGASCQVKYNQHR